MDPNDARFRVMLDSTVPDVLLDDWELTRRLSERVAQGHAEVLITHVQIDEKLLIRDSERRHGILRALFSVGARAVPTALIVLGADSEPGVPEHRQPFAGSRYGMARFGSAQSHALYEKLRGDGLRHIEDAIIAVTALAEDAVLVTDDRLLTRRIQRSAPELRTVSTADLRAWAAKAT